VPGVFKDTSDAGNTILLRNVCVCQCACACTCTCAGPGPVPGPGKGKGQGAGDEAGVNVNIQAVLVQLVPRSHPNRERCIVITRPPPHFYWRSKFRKQGRVSVCCTRWYV